MEPKKKAVRKGKLKKSNRKIEELASALPKYTVFLEKLYENDVKKKIAEIKRTCKVRKLKQMVKELPRKKISTNSRISFD